MSIPVTIAFLVGLLIGIAIDKKARKERDERISELERQISEYNNQSPVRMSEDAIGHAIRLFDEPDNNIEEK